MKTKIYVVLIAFGIILVLVGAYIKTQDHDSQIAKFLMAIGLILEIVSIVPLLYRLFKEKS